MKIKVGDLVELKSGGPKMTVKEIGPFGRNEILCQWFGGKKLEQGFFHPDSLKPAAQPDEK